METRAITTRVPEALAEKLDMWAARLHSSPDAIMKQALTAWFEDEQYQGLLEGMADARAGRYVENSIVREWVDSLDTETPLPVPRYR